MPLTMAAGSLFNKILWEGTKTFCVQGIVKNILKIEIFWL
jgi:hypothetical protein